MVPRQRNHLLMNPATGGAPHIPTAPMVKASHGDRHLSADAGQLTDLFFAGDHHDGPGTKKKGDLHKPVKRDVDHGAFYPEGA